MMTEAEWLGSADLDLMLTFLRRKSSPRKLRLFAVACCRHIWRLLKANECRRAVEAAELYADGMVGRKELQAAARSAEKVASDLVFEATIMMRLAKYAERDAANAAALVARQLLAPRAVAAKVREAVTATSMTPKCQCSVLRDLFGPLLFRTVGVEPAWLSWNDGTVPKIIQGIYDDRAFDRMPVLADALEDAGCDNADILAHCRSGGEHVRGCWVLDLLLGRT
jgi:hypothetical protein